MEKKTIGKFISALRKANGMTQKELGDKLFVSDKTVSRWERDECTPELSLIPSIADIFGITVDELLRGERNNPERAEARSEEEASRLKAKSDRQFKLILDRNSRKYKNLTLISFGITVLGLIVAMIINLGFSKGLIAFCIAAAFFGASEICQICFAINARVVIDDDNDEHFEKITNANTGVTRAAIVVSFFNLLAFAFCLPLVTLIDGANFGLAFESWLSYGAMYSAIAFVIAYIVYELILRNLLCKRELIALSERERGIVRYNNKMLKISIAIFAGIFALVFITGFVSNRLTFEREWEFYNWEDFKEFVEADYRIWYEDTYVMSVHVDENGISSVTLPILPEDGEPSDTEKGEEEYYPNKEHAEYRNSRGELIFEYYYNPELYKDIQFTETESGEIERITVIEEYVGADNNYLPATLFAIDLVLPLGFYVLTTTKNKKKHSNA